MRIAMAEAGAWTWSGVPTTTASIWRPIWSSILRKSRYLLALGNLCTVDSHRRSSTSHRATMSSLTQLPMSQPPWPPAPIPAMESFSLGDLSRAIAGKARVAAPAATDAPINSRRRIRRMDRMTNSPLVGSVDRTEPRHCFHVAEQTPARVQLSSWWSSRESKLPAQRSQALRHTCFRGPTNPQGWRLTWRRPAAKLLMVAVALSW